MYNNNDNKRRRKEFDYDGLFDEREELDPWEKFDRFYFNLNDPNFRHTKAIYEAYRDQKRMEKREHTPLSADLSLLTRQDADEILAYNKTNLHTELYKALITYFGFDTFVHRDMEKTLIMRIAEFQQQYVASHYNAKDEDGPDINGRIGPYTLAALEEKGLNIAEINLNFFKRVVGQEALDKLEKDEAALKQTLLPFTLKAGVADLHTLSRVEAVAFFEEMVAAFGQENALLTSPLAPLLEGEGNNARSLDAAGKTNDLDLEAAKQEALEEKESLPAQSVDISTLTGGSPLSEQERTLFENNFNTDLSDVKVHTDTTANESAESINADAFTVGNDIVFGEEQYQPGTAEGNKLMAHELAHVGEQKASGHIQVQMSSKDSDRKPDEKNKEGKYELKFNIDFYAKNQADSFNIYEEFSSTKQITIFDIIDKFKVINTKMGNRAFEKMILSDIISKLMQESTLNKEYSDFNYYNRIEDSQGNVSVVRFKIPAGHFKPYSFDKNYQYTDPEFKGKLELDASAIFSQRMKAVYAYREMVPFDLLVKTQGNLEAFWKEASPYVHTALDLLGFIPGVGEIADAANALIYSAESDYVNAAISAAAMIPFAGWFATGGRLTYKLEKTVSEKALRIIAEESARQLVKKSGKKTISKEVASEISEQVSKKLYKEFVGEGGKVAVKDLERALADIIRKVGPDILDKMEKAGGHLIEKHVSKTNQELITRGMKEGIEGASTFYNKKIAIEAVQESLRKNANEIAEWLIKEGGRPDKVIITIHKFPIGKGLKAGEKNITEGFSKSKIILLKDSTQELGFKIITGYPFL